MVDGAASRSGTSASAPGAAARAGMDRCDHEPVPDVTIRDDMIRLGQFLKLSGLVDSGSDAKGLLEEGAVQVNDEVETRRGRQLVRGDVVRLGGSSATVA